MFAKSLFYILLSWYSFFNYSPFEGFHGAKGMYKSNPALIPLHNGTLSVSGSFLDEDTKVAELNLFRSNFRLNFIFYNFGTFNYSGYYPDDFVRLSYSAFAYKISLGYAIPLDSCLFLGIEPQYHRYEYLNSYAEGITTNFGLFHKINLWNLYYEIYLKNFGFGSSEGYNFPSTFNLGIGIRPRPSFLFYFNYSQDISFGLEETFKRFYTIQLSGLYYGFKSFTPALTIFLGDELRVGRFSMKWNLKGRFFVFYSVEFRKSGFGLSHSATVGVE